LPLTGATVLYNTYWVRYAPGGTTYAAAVANTRLLIEAAAAAGVRRMVHVSITNPSHDSFYEYYRGKAAIEDLVRASGMSAAIVRPTVIFGDGDILVNNIAWLVRRFHTIATGVGARCLPVGLPPAVVAGILRLLAVVTRDVVLTSDEIRGLMAELVSVDGPATCPTRLTDYLAANPGAIGATYHSELARRR
jgi:NADH dehydrogenase